MTGIAADCQTPLGYFQMFSSSCKKKQPLKCHLTLQLALSYLQQAVQFINHMWNVIKKKRKVKKKNKKVRFGLEVLSSGGTVSY